MQMEGMKESKAEVQNGQRPFVFAQDPVVNPTVPYNGKLQQLHAGDLIIIRGFLPHFAKNFAVNLEQLIDGRKYDVLLHVGVRMLQNTVVRNHRIEGEWAHEEKTNNTGKLEMNKAFQCIIMIRDDCFKIAFNKQHYCDFVHRLPYKQVTHLHIEGTVELWTINVQAGPDRTNYLREIAMPLLQQNGQPKVQKVRKYIQNPLEVPDSYGIPVPTRRQVSCGFGPSSVLYICGIPSSKVTPFTIDLKPVSSFGQRDVDLRIKVMMKQKTVILNTMDNDKWGKEEKITSWFPFKCGVHYDLIIMCTDECYRISVNNVHLTDYKHRYKSIETVNMYEINGATKLIHVRSQGAKYLKSALI